MSESYFVFCKSTLERNHVYFCSFAKREDAERFIDEQAGRFGAQILAVVKGVSLVFDYEVPNDGGWKITDAESKG